MSLTSLPTELIEQIVSYSDLASSRSIRLICTSITRQTQHIFKLQFFRTRTLRWTKDAFDTLLEITDHKDFGNALQNLNVDATPRHSIHLWRIQKQLSEAQAIFGPYNTNSVKFVLSQKCADDTKVAEEFTTFFNETRYDQKCLSKVFTKLGTLDSIIFEYEGMDKKYSKSSRRYCESSQHEMSRPFVSTMAAIAASNIRIQAISVHHSRNYGAVSIGRLESLAPLLRNFDLAFERLEVLKLNLRDWRSPDSGFELDSHRTPLMVRLLAKARNIKVLDLSCHSTLEDDLFEEMARCCTFAHLETCRLSLFRIGKASDLVTFLAPSSSTLKSLGLNHLILCDPESSWQQLLEHLASLPSLLTSLERLELFNVFGENGATMMFNETVQLVVGSKNVAGRWKEELLDQMDAFNLGRITTAWFLITVAYPFVGLHT